MPSTLPKVGWGGGGETMWHRTYRTRGAKSMVFFNYTLLLLPQCDNLSLNLDHQHTLSLAGLHHTYIKGKTTYYNNTVYTR